MQKHFERAKVADGQRSEGAAGRFSGELLMQSHFKQRPLLPLMCNNSRVCERCGYTQTQVDENHKDNLFPVKPPAVTPDCAASLFLWRISFFFNGAFQPMGDCLGAGDIHSLIMTESGEGKKDKRRSAELVRLHSGM